jgi:formylglycine-generating enzyme required for sulfatase activity
MESIARKFVSKFSALLLAGLLMVFGMTNCNVSGGSDDDDDSGTVSCVEDDVCQLACADDPDCAGTGEDDAEDDDTSDCTDADGDSHDAYDNEGCPSGDDNCDNDPNNWTATGCSSCVDSDDDGYGDNCDPGTDCNDEDNTIYAGCPTVGPMVSIPEGCFDMGDSFSEGNSEELPVHNVCISAFKMDVHEVTNAEYKECVDAGICSAPGDAVSTTRSSYYGDPTYDDYPIIYIDWNDAVYYCSWAGKRLPTEAEWEYAARGGHAGYRFPRGDTISCTSANYSSSTSYSFDTEGSDGDCVGDTTEVESYAANSYGLYDMTGNVWEWVSDWYDSGYYSVSSTNDPQGPISGTKRVLRGGSFLSLPWNNRVSFRGNNDPNQRWHYYFGFRCAASGN